MISGNNSAPFLTSMGGKQGDKWQAGYFRTSNNEDTAGGAAAEFAYRELGVRRVATVNDGDIYTRGLTDGFKKVFEELGGKIVLYGIINKGDTNMLPLLIAARDVRAELLFFPLFQSEGSHLVLQAKKVSEMEQTLLMSDGALLLSSFIETVREKGKGMYFVGPAPGEGPASEALASQYAASYKVRPLTSYYQNAYDAACLLFSALGKIANQDADGTLHIGRQALRDALYATRDFKGVTGRLSCDRFGDCAFPRFNILRLDDPSAGLRGLQANVMYTHTPDRSAEEE
jgi:branched-chain amino acid transport system substrate-binding protein